MMRKYAVLLLCPVLLGLLAPILSHSTPPPVVAEARFEPPPKKNEAPTLTLPGTKTARPNRYFFLKATTNCASIKWIVPDGLDQLGPEIPLKDPFAIALIGDTGTYTVQAYGALGDQASDIASCVVTIGTPPPGPGPGPGPAPSALTAALQTAYDQDKDSDRATSLKFLQGVYQGMVTLAPSWSDVTNVGQASAKIQSVVDVSATNPSGLTAVQVVNLRKAIQAEMVSKFGSSATVPITLTALATELSAIAAALRAVK